MEVVKAILSWSHIISATLSMIVGAAILFASKGNAKHKKLGSYYFYVMLINNSTALFIYNSSGKFFYPHWLAIITLIVILLGYFALRIKKSGSWLTIHLVCMVTSYYLLIGGAINETFLRVASLRPLIVSGSPIVGITHFMALLFFMGLLSLYIRKYRAL
jgi:uncharacterized membrane protein